MPLIYRLQRGDQARLLFAVVLALLIPTAASAQFQASCTHPRIGSDAACTATVCGDEEFVAIKLCADQCGCSVADRECRSRERITELVHNGCSVQAQWDKLSFDAQSAWVRMDSKILTRISPAQNNAYRRNEADVNINSLKRQVVCPNLDSDTCRRLCSGPDYTNCPEPAFKPRR